MMALAGLFCLSISAMGWLWYLLKEKRVELDDVRTEWLLTLRHQRQAQRRLRLQYDLVRLLTHASSWAEAVPQILEKICEALGWQVGVLWSVDEATDLLRCLGFWHSPLGRFPNLEARCRGGAFPPGVELPGRVWAKRQPLWTPLTAAEGEGSLAAGAVSDGLYGTVGFPIVQGEEFFGVLEFFGRRRQAPREELLEGMAALGTLLAQFIRQSRSEQMKDEFVRSVSHELRTPLSIMREGMELLLDEISGPLNAKQREILTIARNNVERFDRIFSDLLDISKLEAGKVKLDQEETDLSDLIQQVVTSLEPEAQAKGLLLQVDLPPRPLKVYADPERVIQILIQLAGNALKFTERGSIRICAESREGEATCSVLDTGRGISQVDLPRLFTKFQQFNRMAGAGAKGTGLGLAIAKRLVELHGGRIWAESTIGQGTQIHFSLPSAAPLAHQAAA